MRDEKGRFIKGSKPWHKGKENVYSPEALEKMAAAKRGKPNWRKGQYGVYKHTEEWKKAQSERSKGRSLTEEWKKKIGDANRGEKNGAWRGGVWDRSFSRSAKYEYRVFRKKVLDRDKCCVLCLSTERLEVDHIKPYSQFEELRLDVDNARVLCRECHKKTDTYGSKAKIICT